MVNDMPTPDPSISESMKHSLRRVDNDAWNEIVDVLSLIMATLDPNRVLDAIAQAATKIMQAEASSVLALDTRRKKLIFSAAAGPVGAELIGQEFDAGLGIAGRVIDRIEPEIVRDVPSDPEFFKGIDQKSDFVTREMIAAPMVYRGNVVGVVEVINRVGGDFADSDLETLALFAALAASALDNARVHQQLKRENEGLRTSSRVVPDGIIGQSDALHEVLQLCERVAKSTATVLLLGETGTGKELTARHIHDSSPRKDKPFIGINCAALNETLLESELFGHEKGAFTGAIAKKLGRFELAGGGTLFLDEIGDISQAMQVKLLRVLQEKEFVRVGGTSTVACDVRIIAATNRDLKAAIEEGEFREDLYYRLNVFPINLPPLRRRRDDIAMLVQHFVRVSSKDLGVSAPTVSSDVTALLTSHSWPGNIRELQNVVERMVLMCDGGEILPMHVPREIAGETSELVTSSVETGLRGYERAMIVQALIDHDWNQTQAAKFLNISRDNLRYRVKKYQIEKPAKPDAQ
ncbi:MAG: sigma-54-dependent Fis family transcriptional regulator [Planctomycetes bacterium]|nr:sigma-54-dependent Fis family transcriptional regulator [Planctomycetota bacterium]